MKPVGLPIYCYPRILMFLMTAPGCIVYSRGVCVAINSALV